MTASASGSASQSPSQTATGHPVQPVLSNCADPAGGCEILPYVEQLQRRQLQQQQPASPEGRAAPQPGQAGRANGPPPRQLDDAPLPTGIRITGAWAGFSWAFVEADTACGPGLYTLISLSVALSLPPSAGTSAANVSVTVALLRADAETGLPTGVAGNATTVVELEDTPSWVALRVPFTIDVSNGDRAFAIALSASVVSAVGGRELAIGLPKPPTPPPITGPGDMARPLRPDRRQSDGRSGCGLRQRARVH